MKRVFDLVVSATSIVAAFAFANLCSASAPAKPSPQQIATLHHANYPMSFERNQGQTDPAVEYLSHGQGYVLFLTSTEAVFTLREPTPRKGVSKGKRSIGEPTTFRMRLLGANSESVIQALDAQESKAHYFTGSDTEKWVPNVVEFAKIKYEAVYPGIDLIYYGNQQQLEYDFEVSPKTSPRQIRMNFSGIDQLKIDHDGSLVMRLGSKQIRWHKPVAYQNIDGKKIDVACEFALQGKETVGFHVGTYDSKRPLVIDPVLVYSTYLGGNLLDSVESIAVDSSGNVYVAGETLSANFPSLAGAYRTTKSASNDVFVTKFNSTGTTRLFSTFMGGGGDEFAWGIALDSTNSVYVTGYTDSANFPTANGANNSFGGIADAFLFKLNPTGSSLLYSTYFGSAGYDQANGIAVDSNGNAYIAGESDSTSSTFTREFRSGGASSIDGLCAFVAKFTPSLGSSSLVFADRIGGVTDDRATAIAIDANNNIYITGEVATYLFYTANFPTVNAVQSSYGGGYNDAFVAKISANGVTNLFSTYLGGDDGELGHGIAVDSTGVYIVGETYSTNFPMLNAMQPVIANEGPTDSFVTKLSINGNNLLYSTYFGGQANDEALGVKVDASGNVYVTGRTQSEDLPANGGNQTTYGGGAYDGFLAKINPSIASSAGLVFCTYLGGFDWDEATGIAVDANQNIYVGGLTASTNFVTTGGAYQTSFGGGAFDGFVTKFAAATDLAVYQSASPQPVQLGNNITFTIKINNNGQSTFSGVVVTNQLPPGLTFVSAISSMGSCTQNGNLVTCTLGTVTNNVSATITITATASSATTITNSATVTAIESEANTVNNTATTITSVRGSSDVTLTQSGTPGQVTLGNNITNTVVVQSKGPQNANDVLIVHTFSPGTTLVSSNTTQGTFLVGSLSVTCNVGTMLNGAAVTNTLVLSYSSIGLKTNAATVTAFEIDPLPGNNSSSATTTVSAPGDIGISLVASPSQVFPGTALTYTLTITNGSSLIASNVVVSNIMPANVAYVSAVSTRGTCTRVGQLVTCPIGTLTNGTGATITISVTGNSVGSGTNLATISTTSSDSNPSNDSAAAVTTINLPILSISTSNTNALLTWPSAATAFQLQALGSLSLTNWTAVTNTPSLSNNQFSVVRPINSTNQYFRLIKP